MRLFGWIIEFKLKRKENKNRIKYLVEMLIKELEQQGHDTKSNNDVKDKYFSLFDFGNKYIINGHNMDLHITKEGK